MLILALLLVDLFGIPFIAERSEGVIKRRLWLFVASLCSTAGMGVLFSISSFCHFGF